MNAPLELDWTNANQQYLAAEFTRLRAVLGDGDLDEANHALAACRDHLPAPAAIDALATNFSLSPFERDIVLLAAGIEMDAGIAKVCQQRTGEAFVTFSLALSTLTEPHWSAIAPTAPLRRWRLIEVDDSHGLTNGRIRLAERVLHFLAGINTLDAGLQALMQPAPPVGLLADEHREHVHLIVGHLERQGAPRTIVQLCGSDRAAQRDVARSVTDALAIRLLCLNAAHIPAEPGDCAALATLWQREAMLLGSALLITEADDHASALAGLLRQMQGLVFISTRDPLNLDMPAHVERIDKPDFASERALWRRALADAAPALNETIEALSGRYRLGARRIDQIAALTRTLPHEQLPEALDRHCGGHDAALLELAQRIMPRAGWADLVLPPSQRRTLEQIVVHYRQRIRVLHDWGFARRSERGLGLATLFAGESGTGKTLAAEVLAHELRLPLYRIDLSSVISKYIGETEKNLRKVFDAAEDVGAILLFDEADALFGKRSEVKDSHDRYANIEVSYLLQRMECYRGLAVLTTNHRAALDAAFSRRLRFVVQFPFPDASQREAIWRGIFPKETPTQGLDYARLARLNAAGGTIRNIALGAAFLAAEAGSPVTMALLQQAARAEAGKRDVPFSEAETRGWT
ncbi:ATP-binding protein [Nitrogeniibacter aestuarii]|uniref:ATP-binding protein n=1 Tax=Nitrogeniibacter aestuarii TaxID=2815343 RepID=UPI001D0F656F|nr:ATP-binding protein [Nitrogeniibacter aestuarii]